MMKIKVDIDATVALVFFLFWLLEKKEGKKKRMDGWMDGSTVGVIPRQKPEGKKNESSVLACSSASFLRAAAS